MEDFEDNYKSAVDAGLRNQKAKKLLSNWCYHAELVRSPGRGIIEAETGLPIGHMGVQCKFSKKNVMHCWLLEDAVYDFYQNNCKGCSERLPVGIPNILEFVSPREEAADKRRMEREEDKIRRKQEQSKRREERESLRNHLSLEETFVLDLVDELDEEVIESNDPRLEQLATLAPETFSRNVINHLLPAVLNETLPYSMPAAKALIRAPLEPDEKLSVAVRLVGNYQKSSAAIEEVLKESKRLTQDDLEMVLFRFVSMALGPPPGLHLGAIKEVRLNAEPIRSLYRKRKSDVCEIVDKLIADSNPLRIGTAVEIILATDDDELFEKHARRIFAKLMRRRTLLPEERRDSRVIHYLRKAASRCFQALPEKTDNIIQSFLADNDDTGREEAYRTYRSVLKHRYGEAAEVGIVERVAFKRLLWAAVANPEGSMHDAGQFFRNSCDQFSELAAGHFDDLIGAAATLSDRYEAVGSEQFLELPDSALLEMERMNKRTAIDGLQGALVKWAAVGARSKGIEGVEKYLDFYRKLPKDQTQMRGKMIAHVSKLLTGVDSLTIVLSDWYGALMDDSTLVRSSAVKAWEDVPYELIQNFPDLFFEAFSVLLTDPYVIVHRSAVHSLRRRSFPEEKRGIVKRGLWNLIICYAKEKKKDEFIVYCIDAFSFLCLSPEERRGESGKLLTAILLTLEGDALYCAVDRLHHGFSEVPGFSKVALKAIQDDYTRSISTDDCASAILKAPQKELKNCLDEIQMAFKELKPYRPEGFVEALLYAAVLTKAGGFAASGACFKDLLDNIPVEERNDLWRIETALVAVASDIEHSIDTGEAFSELIDRWRGLMSDLEKENEERAKLRDFPPSFFFED